MFVVCTSVTMIIIIIGTTYITTFLVQTSIMLSIESRTPPVLEKIKTVICLGAH